MGKLVGRVALITGGNSSTGLATARQFVHEGAYVFITGRRESELAASVKKTGGNVTGVQGDVANLGDLDRLFAQIKRDGNGTVRGWRHGTSVTGDIPARVMRSGGASKAVENLAS